MKQFVFLKSDEMLILNVRLRLMLHPQRQIPPRAVDLSVQDPAGSIHLSAEYKDTETAFRLFGADSQ